MTGRSSHTRNSYALIAVIVSRNGVGISGAVVTATITLPYHTTAHGRAATTPGGKATFLYQIGRTAPLGKYMVTITDSTQEN